MNPLLERIVGVTSSMLVPVAQAWAVAERPLARLGRLTRLRASARGEIPVTTQFDGPVHAVGRPKLTLGRACRLGRGVHLETGEQGSIHIGSQVRLSAGVHIVSHSSTVIGDDCLIGEYASIRDADHGTVPGAPYCTQHHVSKPIRLGSNVWIGRGSVILKGVTIGDDAVIGANSVVTRDIPAGCLAVGAPARVLRAVSGTDREVHSPLAKAIGSAL